MIIFRCIVQWRSPILIILYEIKLSCAYIPTFGLVLATFPIRDSNNLLTIYSDPEQHA